MSNINEQSTLVEAMSFAAVKSLPPEWDGKSDFSRAIAKVKKADNSIAYVIVQRNNGRNVVIKDFGVISTIVSFISIHPYDSERHKPIFRTKPEMVAYVVKNHLVMNEEEGKKLSKVQLTELIDTYWNKE